MPRIRMGFLFFSLVAASIAVPKIQRATNSFGIMQRENSTQGDLPYHVAIQYPGSHLCSGALIVINETQLVVTAAHCVTPGEPDGHTVVAGDVNRMDNSGFEQSRLISRVQVHPGYDNVTYANDIALLSTSTPFDINENVAPISLPTQHQQTSGPVVVSGWAMAGGFTSILQKFEGQIVDDDTCQRTYGHVAVIRPSMICTAVNSSINSNQHCMSEVGGPVRAVEGGYLAGISSWSFRCSSPQYPDTSTEVSYFIDWIHASVL